MLPVLAGKNRDEAHTARALSSEGNILKAVYLHNLSDPKNCQSELSSGHTNYIGTKPFIKLNQPKKSALHNQPLMSCVTVYWSEVNFGRKLGEHSCLHY